jgi:hypothetical protein
MDGTTQRSEPNGSPQRHEASATRLGLRWMITSNESGKRKINPTAIDWLAAGRRSSFEQIVDQKNDIADIDISIRSYISSH